MIVMIMRMLQTVLDIVGNIVKFHDDDDDDNDDFGKVFLFVKLASSLFVKSSQSQSAKLFLLPPLPLLWCLCG